MAELATLVDRRAVMADLVLLDGECISEDGIISALKDRYERDEIYTNIGDVVVSINPFHLLAIYGEEHMRAYNVKSDMVFRLSPHIFSLANAAYRNLKAFRTDQVVLITGESGSGKTEAAKIIMRYLASVSGSEAHASHIKVQLLQSNPVMEAFGNARTLRNGNSSRFGKYMDMQFNYAAEAVGGEITSYLLEKSRVVFQAEGERSFHMFYYLLAGAEEGLLDFLGLQRDAGAYQLLSRSGSHLIDQQDHDAGMFRRLIKSCQAVGFSSESVQMLLELTAAILHLGNVEVAEETTSDGNDYVFIRPSDSFGHAAARLCITPEQLATAFTRRTVSSSGESFLVSLTLDQAIFARESMCKAIYERMFKLIVHTINRKIKVDPSVCVPSDVRRLGVLDIYGFEVFPANAFEQLCINYCNEKLQQLFVSLTIEREQQLYISEGLDWVQIDYFNNKAICALLENTPNGIFPTLDEQGLLQNDSDTVFLEELTSRNQNDPHYETRKGNNKEFTVHHYAGAVTYQIEGMIRKNNDTLFKDISRAMFRSSNATVSSLFPEGGFSDAELMKRPVGAAIQFKRSINELRANIASKQPHYIRCVKPNDDQAPHTFDWTTIAMQVQYLGMLENVRVARAGFAFREDTTWFEMRYRCLCIPRLFPRTPAHMTSAEAVALILHEAKIPSSAYVVGRTKVFFREPQHIEQLERLRDKTRPYMVRLIQPFYRGWRVRREYWKMRRAARTIQVAWKVRRYLPIYEPMRVLYHAYLAFTKLGKLKEAYMEPNEWTKPNEAEFITQNAVPRVAAYTIQWAWRRYKMRLMVKHMLMHMRSTRRLGWVKGNKTEMESWPDACGPRGQTFLTLMQTRFALWSAREYRRACTVQQQAMLILKAQCSDLFLGNKANYYRSINKVFRPNSFNIKEEKNYRKWEKLFPVGGYEKVHFANIVVKIKRSDFKRHSRILTMTNKHLYILDPSFKVKATIPFDAVSEVSVSPYQDNVFVLHLDMKEMHGNQERKGDFMFMSDELCEIITKLSMQYKFATRFQLKINFSKVISVRLKPPNFKRIRFSLSRTTHVSSFINKAGDMEMVCPDTAEHILAADRDTLRRTRSNEAVITNGAFARKVPMERYDSVVGDIADLMNEQQYARFMETGTLPRNFEFKTTEDALLE